MRVRRHVLALAATLAVMASFAVGGVAQAAFPNFAGCTPVRTEPVSELCLDIQNRSGNLNIKGFNVPLGESLEIRGKLRANATGGFTFIPPSGTNGFFSRAVPVPGGLLGIEWIPGTSVLAITELAGPASSIIVDINTLAIRIPIKVRLENLLIGMNCHIGTDSSPVVLNLITGTTSPPPPNRPITGRVGTPNFGTRAITFTGNLNVDNTFAIPGASSCGLGLGLINALVNAKLRLPSAAGNNSADIINDVALGTP